MLLTIGSGLGLLSLATMLADLALLNIATKRKFYTELKVLDYKSQNYLEKNKHLFVHTNPIETDEWIQKREAVMWSNKN